MSIHRHSSLTTPPEPEIAAGARTLHSQVEAVPRHQLAWDGAGAHREALALHFEAARSRLGLRDPTEAVGRGSPLGGRVGRRLALLLGALGLALLLAGLRLALLLAGLRL